MNYLNKIEVIRITNAIFNSCGLCMHVYIYNYIDCHSNFIQILILVIAIWRREMFLNHGA